MMSSGTLSVNFGHVLIVGRSTGVDSDTLLSFLVGRLKRSTVVSVGAPPSAVSGCVVMICSM